MKYIYSKIVMFIVLWFAVFIEVSSITEEQETIHRIHLSEAQQARIQSAIQHEENVAYWEKENSKNVNSLVEWDKQAIQDLPPLYKPKN